MRDRCGRRTSTIPQINVSAYSYKQRRRIRNQQRANAHHVHRDRSTFIELVDVTGARTLVEGEGRLTGIRHTSILSTLTQRANRYKSNTTLNGEQQLNNLNLDDTRTTSIPPTLDHGAVRRRQEELTRTRVLEARQVNTLNTDETLTTHGSPPASKQEGVFRLLYENAHGIDCRQLDGYKVSKARALHDSLEADAVAYNEHRLNLRHPENHIGFNQLFHGGETEIRSIAAHNVHENVERKQEGGTALLLFGPLIQQLDITDSGKDETGLGRWVVMTLQGTQGFRTRIVCGYNPCGNNRLDSGTVYAQHSRFFRTHQGSLVCPRVKFREDLTALLAKWREEGDRLIVCLDANEDIYKKSIGKALTDSSGLNMREVVGEFTGKKIGATFCRGTKPIDGVWATRDLQIASACIMPAGYGIGDHRLFVVDILTSTMVGHQPTRVARPCARRLNTKIPGALTKYNERLESLVLEHRIIERMGAAHETSTSNEEVRSKMDAIDSELGNYMASSENTCRKIKSGRIPFSPEAQKWIRRRQVYQSLLSYVIKGTGNRGNLIRSARRSEIAFPMQLTEDQILLRLEVCDDHCEYYRLHGAPYRRRHLLNRADIARADGDEDVANRILDIVRNEKIRHHWRQMKHSMQQQQGRSVQAVQVEQTDGTTMEYTDQAGIEQAIWDNIHRKRFYLAEEAPICQGELRGEFGYSADTAAGRAVMDGSYTPGEEADPATMEIFAELERLRQLVPANSVSDLIRGPDWSRFWSKSKESTSSSESGLHFGHRIASAKSPLLSHTYATQCSILLRRGIHLTRWSRGLSVMIEKLRGCTLISKLRSILLMEADFNCTNKIIYGERMMDNARKYNLIPDEIFSEKNRMADDGTLSKTLLYDLARQSRRPAGVSSVDADNCYDRVSHAIASLVCQAFGVSESTVCSMLKTIQEMQFFLRTAFGDSTQAAGSSIEIKTQGLCQGNGAAPAGWAVVSIAILNAHKKKGHGATFLCPISELSHTLAAVLYVDDTDVIHFRMDSDETVWDTHRALQDSILSWGNLLIATGGSLKPSKCFYHLIAFAWRPDGSWVYQALENEDTFNIVIPLPDDSVATIEHLGVDKASKTLGSMTCPSGNSTAAHTRMKDQAQEWIDRAKNGRLSRRNLFELLDRQFTPKVCFGIGTSTASLADLSETLHHQYYQLLPLGGIRRSVRKEIRYLGLGFYGSGLPHLGIECFTAQLDKLLTHYGCSTTVGKLLQSSMELFIIELGMSPQPFQVSYQRYGHLTTSGWLKSVWEKAAAFNMVVSLGNLISPPRLGDCWLMVRFAELGYSKKELLRLNRVRIHQQVLFLSDVLDAGGRAIDKKYVLARPRSEKWSTLCFPLESPARKDFRLWRSALLQLRPGTRHADSRVQAFVSAGHKLWDWRYDEVGLRLLHLKRNSMDVYTQSLVPGFTRRPNCWTRSRIDVPVSDVGVLCTVRETALAVRSICSYAPRAPAALVPTSFWEVLIQWDCLWMWDSVQLVGPTNWIAEAIASGSCIAVTDGSYQPKYRSDICSAAFFFESSDRKYKLVGAFPERSETANAYRGELLGLLAIHLILLAVNKVNPAIVGSVTIYSDCERALGGVETLPALNIPSSSKHSDILKTILVNCNNLSFVRNYQHISAHQDDNTAFHSLSRPAQLNCAVDAGAKRQIRAIDPETSLPQRAFPLEPITCFAGRWKLTPGMKGQMRFWCHKILARVSLADMKVLTLRQFDEVAWPQVHQTLGEVPRMFQIWACKQVLGIARTNHLISKWDLTVDPRCPSCLQCPETPGHILHCNEAGRLETLLHTIDLLARWLRHMHTDPRLVECIVSFARGRGSIRMRDICRTMGARFLQMARSQDIIGWRRFMEGMISKDLLPIQTEYYATYGMQWRMDRWSTGLITKLLEITHGQWLYRNVVVHDTTAGRLALARKEEILAQIEEQMAKGGDDLLESEQYLMEVNLDGIDESHGTHHEYWLLAIRAARIAGALAREQDGRPAGRGVQRRSVSRPRDGHDYG